MTDRIIRSKLIVRFSPETSLSCQDCRYFKPSPINKCIFPVSVLSIKIMKYVRENILYLESLIASAKKEKQVMSDEADNRLRIFDFEKSS